MNIAENSLFEALQSTPSLHARDTALYQLLDSCCLEFIKNSDFQSEEPTPVPFGPFGNLMMPFQKMGAITSLDLFGLDELILFSFYLANKGRIKKAVDIGANLGLHSILMAKLGISVTSYEPDDIHFTWFNDRLALNEVLDKVTPVKAAVSSENGTAEFVRVEGNTTGSHLAGAKSNPYGNLTKYMVDIKAAADVFKDVDFAKIDAEGHETVILQAIPAAYWDMLETVVEVGTAENAEQIYSYFTDLGVNLFSQKTGWQKAASLDDIPVSYKEGSLFISKQPAMVWG
ncbi:FkbM family methyltransferase [Sneathiella sp.]|jgi:FkbM family methyltransferase|uniref:FkbM family methyltransferase n=1 Tax=Sneathiella sp. TaxID=1964365 RepID=UPI0039E52385